MRVQATQNRAKNLCYALLACAPLLGCSDPVGKPVDLFHDLEGGEIAAQRPPPPGAGMPYPHVGTVPAKPVMPDVAYRRALQNQLASERDDKELMAADIPIEKVPSPPPAQTPPPPSPASAPAEGAAPADDTGSTANATIPAAESAPAAVSATPAPPAAPPQDAALQIVGDPIDTPGLPLVPDGPPPPATFEGVPALPAPTPQVRPVRLAAPAGTPPSISPGQRHAAALADTNAEGFRHPPQEPDDPGDRPGRGGVRHAGRPGNRYRPRLASRKDGRGRARSDACAAERHAHRGTAIRSRRDPHSATLNPPPKPRPPT